MFAETHCCALRNSKAPRSWLEGISQGLIRSVCISLQRRQFSTGLSKTILKILLNVLAKFILDRFDHEEEKREKSQTERLALKPLTH